MDERGGLAAVVVFTLVLLGPAALAGAGDPGTSRVDRVEAPQRGEDPLQAPRGDMR